MIDLRRFACRCLMASATCAATLIARGETVVLDGRDIDRVAAIADVAPRMSWAMWENATGQFSTGAAAVAPGRSLLLRYSLEKIPPGHRITHAEWILPVSSVSGSEVRFYIWRMLGEWGPGVSHLYRTVEPEPVEWVRPGARGLSSDRATRPSEIVRVDTVGDRVINVTEDVEIWYTRSAANAGWILTIEDPASVVQFAATPMAQAERWRLRITYEPE